MTRDAVNRSAVLGRASRGNPLRGYIVAEQRDRALGVMAANETVRRPGGSK
jgi:hypothetical protein